MSTEHPTIDASLTTESARQARADQAALLVVLGVCALACLLVGAGRPDASNSAEPVCAANGKLAPNVAAWWELAQLPGLGEVTAKAVVEYREARAEGTSRPVRAFREAADLQAVKGIGPKRSEQLRPHLIFETGD
jgi:DNA uptake protein ComE-like DNA-binding protein